MSEYTIDPRFKTLKVIAGSGQIEPVRTDERTITVVDEDGLYLYEFYPLPEDWLQYAQRGITFGPEGRSTCGEIYITPLLYLL